MSDQSVKERPEDQPLPSPGQRDVFPEAIKHLKEREQVGISRYKRTLQTKNGRSMLRDSWEEAADLYVYLTGLMMEQGEL